MGFVAQTLAGQLLGGLLSTLLLFITDLPMSKYHNNWGNGEIFFIELIIGIAVALVYYIAVIDVSMKTEYSYPYMISCIYAGITLAFPEFCSGNFLRLFTGLNTDVGFILCSVGGQLLGNLAGALAYKFLFCRNKEFKSKEDAVNENETKKMEF